MPFGVIKSSSAQINEYLADCILTEEEKEQQIISVNKQFIEIYEQTISNVLSKV